MTFAVLGAGAFGSALAIALARGGKEVMLWGRNSDHIRLMQSSRQNQKHLGNTYFPPSLSASDNLREACQKEVIFLAVPMQQLSALLSKIEANLDAKVLIACCKGIDLSTGQGPTEIIKQLAPKAEAALLTGPSFASDIAKGLPTALTLACRSTEVGNTIQHDIATDALRIYRSEDVTGAELGGALKNVIAIACGIAIGAGLGDSARAALMTRGYSEICRMALALGAKPETLSGLSGLGDLSLTCMSEGSRNYRYGRALGSGHQQDETQTVEGKSTAQAAVRLAQKLGLDMPVTKAVDDLVSGRIDVAQATRMLMSRPQKEE